VLATLIRKNAIETLTGTALFMGPRTLNVRLPDGTVREIEAPRTIIATGSGPIALPGIPFDGKFVLSPDELTVMDAIPAASSLSAPESPDARWLSSSGLSAPRSS